jgi:hypothetical protein
VGSHASEERRPGGAALHCTHNVPRPPSHGPPPSRAGSRLAPTHDCNAAQLQQLARLLGGRGRRLEAVLHQHLPIFHTEHCVFCRFLSDGNDYRDCGHPCESNTVHLRDEKGGRGAGAGRR